MFPVVKCPVLRSPLCSSICFVCRWWRPCTMAMMDLKSLCGSRPTSPGTFLHFTVTNLAGYIITFYSDQPRRVHYCILQWPTLPGTLLNFTVTNLAGYIFEFTVTNLVGYIFAFYSEDPKFGLQCVAWNLNSDYYVPDLILNEFIVHFISMTAPLKKRHK